MFCGIGGFDMGLEAAARELGIECEIVAAYDSWEPAVRVYNANHRPVAQVANVKKMSREDLPPHDLIIGGPPCQDHSLAGQRKCQCNTGGPVTERCCLADFVRLAGDTPYIMENVVSRLINAGWSERLCAADFGDVTSRKRWFYSNYLLHVVPTPGPLRIRDIRDHDEDARILQKRYGCKAGNHQHFDDTLDTLDTLAAHSWHGHDIRGNGKLLGIPARAGADGASAPSPLGSNPTSGSYVGFIEGDYRAARRYYAKLRSAQRKNGTPQGDDDFLPSMTSSPHGGVSGYPMLRLGLRGNSASASASAFNDDEVLGSVLANSFHGNEASKLVGCRNPSLLEMARAHSIPDSFDWSGANKTQRGQMIANSVPAMMAKGVSKALLPALKGT